MAQRAYRQRKESTLDDLRKRVSELANTIEQMNKMFVDCRDRLAATGLDGAHLRDLREVSLQFEDFVRSSRHSGENESMDHPSNDEVHEPKAAAAPLPTRQVTVQPKNVASWMDNLEVDRAARENPLTQIKMGYSLMNAEEKAAENQFDMQLALSSLARPKSQPDFSNFFDNFNIEIPGMDPLHNSVPMPKTYSFQETTFGRRLHRACLESGYHLLIHPETNPEIYERVFRFSTMMADRPKLIAAMKKILDRGPHEPLELFEAAKIRIGGAGTHYPRRDHLGNVWPRAESFNIGAVDLSTLSILYAAARDTPATDMTVDLSGFEGEWFDPYDVEGYLAERGIFIDPSSSFAEVELAAIPGTPSSPAPLEGGSTDGSTISGGLASPHTPTLTDSSFFGSASEGVESMDTNTSDFGVAGWPSEFDTMGYTNIGFSDASTGSWMNFLQPGEAVKLASPSNPANEQFAQNGRLMQLQTPPQQPRKMVLIDVTKFIKGEFYRPALSCCS